MADGGRPDQFWFCLKHHRVETVEDLCPAKHRLGPYDSAAAAARALETVEERNEEWDSDPRWNDSPAGED